MITVGFPSASVPFRKVTVAVGPSIDCFELVSCSGDVGVFMNLGKTSKAGWELRVAWVTFGTGQDPLNLQYVDLHPSTFYITPAIHRVLRFGGPSSMSTTTTSGSGSSITPVVTPDGVLHHMVGQFLWTAEGLVGQELAA